MRVLRKTWTIPQQHRALFACLVEFLLLMPSTAGMAQETTPHTPQPDPETGVITYTEYDGALSPHEPDEVLYAQIPPVGGPHNGVWQDCGFYSEPIYNWHGVHSLEHGAVWITYDPELPASDIAELEALASQSHLLITPYPGLEDPVIASSWGRQVRLDGVDDPRLQQFIIEFRQNPETTPEPGALCSLGNDTTMNPGETPQTEPAVISGTPEEVADAAAQGPSTPEDTGTDLRDEMEDSD